MHAVLLPGNVKILPLSETTTYLLGNSFDSF